MREGHLIRNLAAARELGDFAVFVHGSFHAITPSQFDAVGACQGDVVQSLGDRFARMPLAVDASVQNEEFRSACPPEAPTPSTLPVVAATPGGRSRRRAAVDARAKIA